MDPNVERSVTTTIESIDDSTSFLVTTRIEKRKMRNEDIKVVLARQKEAVAKAAERAVELRAQKEKEIADNLSSLE